MNAPMSQRRRGVAGAAHNEATNFAVIHAAVAAAAAFFGVHHAIIPATRPAHP